MSLKPVCDQFDVRSDNKLNIHWLHTNNSKILCIFYIYKVDELKSSPKWKKSKPILKNSLNHCTNITIYEGCSINSWNCAINQSILNILFWNLAILFIYPMSTCCLNFSYHTLCFFHILVTIVTHVLLVAGLRFYRNSQFFFNQKKLSSNSKLRTN